MLPAWTANFAEVAGPTLKVEQAWPGLHGVSKRTGNESCWNGAGLWDRQWNEVVWMSVYEITTL